MRLLQRIILAAAGIMLCGCNGFEGGEVGTTSGPVNVVLSIGDGPGTKTTYNSETRRFVWQAGDAVSVWARSSAGTYSLDGQTFNLLAAGADGTSAYFSATLQSPMPEGTYSYYITYPLPDSAEGGKAVFSVPAVQDGSASDGVDIIIAEPVEGPALAPIETGSPIVTGKVLKIKMKHLLHFLRFYIPEGKNVLGEPLTRIEFSMPQAIAGTVSVNVTDASTATLGSGTNSMVLDLKDPIGENESAVAGIFPPEAAYSSEDQMSVIVYSENRWAALAPVSLTGRTFAAGHITPVPLRPTEAKTLYQIRFTLASNNLGEDPRSIKLALPEGVYWPGSASNEMTLGGTGAAIKVGDTFVVKTKDEADFRALSSQTLTVSYDSENALVSENIALGDLTTATSATCSLNCPYLFFEDFSDVGDISSGDKYATSNMGSKDPVTFLNGWSAARVGAKAGTSLRIACRRETSANYAARADSPFLSGLKANRSVSLDITFDYSMDRQNGGIGPVDVSQTMYVGYITTDKSLKSGDSTGDYPVSYTSDETGGSYTNVNHTYNAVLADIKAPIRLSWRTMPESKAGLNNSTCWLYIDNIKVKIKK